MAYRERLDISPGVALFAWLGRKRVNFSWFSAKKLINIGVLVPLLAKSFIPRKIKKSLSLRGLARRVLSASDV
jgi:hypothetical protein